MEHPMGYQKALDLLRRVSGPHGFTATTGQQANYGRIWARDGVICGLAGLLSGEPDLIAALNRTLETLRRHQGPHGEIPSNVSPEGKVSYGSLAGRADAPLWYVIGAMALAAREPRSLARHEGAVRRALWLCGAWEYNDRGFIYVPMGGSWADEHILHGYALHVQLLYLWALRAAGTALGDGALLSRAGRLQELITENFWLAGEQTAAPYHPPAYRRTHADGGAPSYWLASFHPGGYETLFDGLGNGLALLLGLEHADAVGLQVARMAEHTGSYLTPAFYPAITPEESRWPELERYYLYEFRNRPWEYHNGGLWPMVTGFMAAGLAAGGAADLAGRLAAAIDAANAEGEWGFYEFHHGLTGEPGGMQETAWSAAGAVLAHAGLNGLALPGLHKEG